MLEIDQCHIDLISSLIKTSKPKKVLELGFGSGKSSRAIIDALKFNQTEFNYTLVENWVDWNYKPQYDQVQFLKGEGISLVNSDELHFVFSTQDTYDFILSDADHWNTDKWFEYVFKNLLNDGGILIYHDVSLGPHKNVDLYFKNLDNIYYKAKGMGLKMLHFNKSSRDDEKCERGLLVIFSEDTK